MKNIKDIKEWISDNLRYLLLGLAALLVIVIIFLVIRLVTNWGKKEVYDGRTEAETEQAGRKDEKESYGKSNVSLVSNDKDILDVITRYYEAKADKDYETIREINPAFSAEDEADLANNNVFESYDNISVYSAEGIEKDSYLVYVYFDLKISGVPTPIPTLVDEYLQKNDDGDLVIADKYSTQERVDFIEGMRTSDAVQGIAREVNQKLEKAAESDEELKEYVEKAKAEKEKSSDSDEEEDTSSADVPEVNGTARATTEVRVRSEASTNGTIYGMLTTGFSVTVLENLDNGWSKIRYTTGGVTIEGYVMTQYLEADNSSQD